MSGLWAENESVGSFVWARARIVLGLSAGRTHNDTRWSPKASTLTLAADDAFRLNALWEIVQTRFVRRNVPVKNLTRGELQPSASNTVRQDIILQQGIPSEAARDIVKFLKERKLRKVQASIQGDQLRVTSGSKDELQDVMRLLGEQDFGVALQFGNYRG